VENEMKKQSNPMDKFKFSLLSLIFPYWGRVLFFEFSTNIKKKFETKIVSENINKRDQGFKVTTPFFLYYLFTPISQPY